VFESKNIFDCNNYICTISRLAKYRKVASSIEMGDEEEDDDDDDYFEETSGAEKNPLKLVSRVCDYKLG